MGLRTKFTLLLVILASLFLAYIHFLVAPQMSRRVLAIEEQAHRAQLQLTAEAIAPPLLENDLAKVYELLDAIRYDNPSWLQLQLFSPAGRRLYPLNEPAGFEGIYPLLQLEEDIGFLQPAIGRLRVAIDMTAGVEAEAQLEGTLRAALVPFLILLLLALWLELELRIRRPLAQIVLAARQLVKGDGAQPVPVHKRDELGELARAFDDMRASMQRNHIDLAAELQEQRQRASLLQREKQQAEFDAIHDALTGLLNRRELERQVAIALDQVQTHHWKHHILLFIDLDHFKAVNDNCGHQAGDHLLCEISHVMRERIREQDVLARVGGDEFAILLKDCELQMGVRIANDICGVIQHHRSYCDNRNFQIGASIGVAPLLSASGTLAQVLAAADAACYEAKRKGRNRVEVAVADVDVKAQSDQVA